MMPYFSIQVNSKFDVKVQSVTNIIVQSTKYAFENFKVQSIISGII